uniref:Uncharacterized protein n=1 Tax=Plectus sambesii TaxID=2011161 RepID=A0A914X2F4_9BILA
MVVRVTKAAQIAMLAFVYCGLVSAAPVENGCHDNETIASQSFGQILIDKVETIPLKAIEFVTDHVLGLVVAAIVSAIVGVFKEQIFNRLRTCIQWCTRALCSASALGVRNSALRQQLLQDHSTLDQTLEQGDMLCRLDTTDTAPISSSLMAASTLPSE